MGQLTSIFKGMLAIVGLDLVKQNVLILSLESFKIVVLIYLKHRYQLTK